MMESESPSDSSPWLFQETPCLVLSDVPQPMLLLLPGLRLPVLPQAADSCFGCAPVSTSFTTATAELSSRVPLAFPIVFELPPKIFQCCFLALFFLCLLAAFLTPSASLTSSNWQSGSCNVLLLGPLLLWCCWLLALRSILAGSSAFSDDCLDVPRLSPGLALALVWAEQAAAAPSASYAGGA